MVLPLRYVADVLVSNVDKKSTEGEQAVRLVNYTDVYYQDRITADLDLMRATASADQIARFALREGDTIITKDSETADDIAVPAYVANCERDMVCGYHLAIIRPRSEVDGRYLSWALRSDFVRGQYAVAANGMTRYGLTYDAIESANIPLPEHLVQRRIADFLDDQVARIDNIVDSRRAQRVLWKLEARAETALAIAGARYGNAAEHQLLGPVAVDWPVMRLKDVVRRVGVGVVVNPSSYFADDGVPFIHGGNVRAGAIDLREVRRITSEDSAKLWRSRLDAGDVVVVRAGYPGRAAVIPEALAGANCASVLLIKPSPLALPEWLELFFNSTQGRSQVALVQYGAAQEQINVGDVVNFALPVPSAVIQREVLDQLRVNTAGALLFESYADHQISLLHEMRQSLITAAVTGKFDVGSADGSRVPA